MKKYKDKDREEISLESILTLMPGNVFWKDKNGKYLGVNNNLAKLLGLTNPSDIIGKTNNEIMDISYATELDQIDQDCINSSQKSFYEEPGFNEKGEPAIYFTQKLPLQNKEGEVVGLVGISMDITERKKIEHELQIAKEKAEASNQAKSQFLAVINHELRTPLTGILGLVTMLKKNAPPLGEHSGIIHDLDNCAQYLLTLVNDVLDFTTLDSNKKELQLEAVDLNELVHEVFSILGGMIKNKGLNFISNLDKKTPLLLTDAKSIRQILINLIGNAIKFTDTGSIQISITHNRLNDTKIALEIKISDTGHGIPSDKLDLIFEPFKQLEDTYIRHSSRSGTGLGLAIVKRLVGLLNCSIHVDSELNKGSTFAINGEFAVAPNQHISQPKLVTNTPSKILPGQKRHVLLIEDDRIVQLIHRRMLTDLHCDIDLAHCGQEALSLLGQHDIAFVDIGLSDMTGFELIKHIRKHQEKTRHTFPIIALTGYTGEKEKLTCLEAGADEVAVKPISIEKLGELLDKYC